MREKGIIVPNGISGGADDMYGNVSRIHQDTAMLCEMCQNLTEKEQNTLLYDGRKEMARELAAWWEKHQKADKARGKKERADKKNAKLRETAAAKLTPEERKALGL
jgi:hypothetical protein